MQPINLCLPTDKNIFSFFFFFPLVWFWFWFPESGDNWHFYITELPIYKYSVSLHLFRLPFSQYCFIVICIDILVFVIVCIINLLPFYFQFFSMFVFNVSPVYIMQVSFYGGRSCLLLWQHFRFSWSIRSPYILCNYWYIEVWICHLTSSFLYVLPTLSSLLSCLLSDL